MESKQAASALGALAQETRLDLLRLLIGQGASGLAAGKIATALNVPPSTLSFHLNALENAGLTIATRQGRQIVHAVRIAGLRELLTFLTEACCGDRPELCGDLGRLFTGPEWGEKTMVPAFNVLFLCTRNSARSIMAEAILNKVGRGKFRAYSAGSDPAGQPLPEVIERLAGLDYEVDGLHCKSWDVFTGDEAPAMDFVIALCDTLDGQTCPDFGNKAVTGSWPLPDPAKFEGDASQRSLLLNELYAGLKRRLEIFASLPFASLDRMAARARLDEIGDPVRV